MKWLRPVRVFLAARRVVQSSARVCGLLLIAAVLSVAGSWAGLLLAAQQPSQAPLPQQQSSPPQQAPQAPPQAAPPPQGQQQEPTYSTAVNVVNVLATVRTKKGEVVSDLTKDDFELEEDGHPETITYFARESDLPLTVGLLVDTSLSQQRVLGQERTASYSFLDDMLRPKDEAFVIHFEGEVELLQDLTSSRKQLEAALDLLQTPTLARRNGPYGGGGGYPGGGGSGGGRGTGGTALYDAVYLASNELMKKQPGRKALIILSDGVDNASKVTLESAIESAQRADTLVYSILFSDPDAYGGGGFGGFGGMGRMGRHGGGFPQRFPPPDGKGVLNRISKETGGRLFEVSRNQTIDQIYSTIEEELRNQYNLGFTPQESDREPGYHKIRLTAHPKDLIVQTRDGYYSN